MDGVCSHCQQLSLAAQPSKMMFNELPGDHGSINLPAAWDRSAGGLGHWFWLRFFQLCH